MASPVQPRSTASRIGRIGLARRSPLSDAYHFLLTSSWGVIYGLMVCAYVAINTLFATLYWLDGGIENARPGSFLDAYFFSVQTMATIGYGKMTPVTAFSNWLVSFEALFGLVAFALATGLMFAKFSQPRARVLFGQKVVVTVRDGKLSLLVRLANERSTGLVEATLRLSLVREEKTVEGESLRRIHTLALTRSTTSVFAFSWTAVHPIDVTSPLHGQTAETLAASNADLVASLVGIEEATGQNVHARYTWSADQIHFGHRFVDILVWLPDGRRAVDYTRFHEVEPVGETAPKPAPNDQK
jgi:inward rectifier potassium channel